MPQILKVKPSNPESWESMIAETQKVLKAGGVIAFPTDTFYGLGANPYSKKAVDKIYSIKGRDPGKPLLLLIDSILKLDDLVEEISEASAKLIESFWPGPLTMLFKPKHTIPKNITTGLIGIRQPGNSITRKILAGLNYPLTAPKVNPRINCFCKIKNIITGGSAQTIEPAAIRFQDATHWPRNT